MAEEFEFDFDRTQKRAWAEFSLRLSEVLSVMDSTANLTISVADIAGPDPGIRFAMNEPGIIDAFVRGSAGGDPTDAEADALSALGWQNPTDQVPQFHAREDQEHSGELADLATRTLAEIFGVLHPVFLEPDQLAEILKGSEEWVPLTPRALAREQRSIMPTNRSELEHLVADELRRLFGHPPLRNEQGDWAIRVGSTMVFLRCTEDREELLIFSALVHEVSGRSRACEVLNDLNVASRYGRFALHRDRVFIQLSVHTQPFVPAHLHQALHAISRIADGIDDELASKLGGRTTFMS